jgi:hypothetical protein
MHNLLAAVIAAALVLGAFFAVKSLMTVSSQVDSDRQMIVYLEMLVMGLILASVAFREFVETIMSVYDRLASGTHSKVEHDYKGIALLFIALCASLAIYFLFVGYARR